MKKRVTFAFLLGIASGTAGARSLRVSNADLGKAWPLSVSEGVLTCSELGRLQAVTFTAPNGVTYAVNGGALTATKFPRINPIWLPGDPYWIKDPQTGKRVNVGSPKKDIGPLLERGLALCK